MRHFARRVASSIRVAALPRSASAMWTAAQQNRPLLEAIKTLLKANWAGKNPGLLTDIFQPSEARAR
jgi:hypothetical protein